ncbi:hypothetical protein ACFPRL_34465 [Pseudoclavibacter helvolus]
MGWEQKLSDTGDEERVAEAEQYGEKHHGAHSYQGGATEAAGLCVHCSIRSRFRSRG